MLRRVKLAREVASGKVTKPKATTRPRRSAADRMMDKIDEDLRKAKAAHTEAELAEFMREAHTPAAWAEFMRANPQAVKQPAPEPEPQAAEQPEPKEWEPQAPKAAEPKRAAPEFKAAEPKPEASQGERKRQSRRDSRSAIRDAARNAAVGAERAAARANRKCEHCGKPLTAERSTMRFCSTHCRVYAHRNASARGGG